MPKDRSYWQQRFDQIEQSANNQSVTYVQELEEKYRIATQAIEGKIEAWYQRLAQNNKVSVTEARRLLRQAELEEFHWTVEQYIKAGKENAIDERWLKELENASARFHINRLEALKLDIRQQIELATGGLVDNTYTLLRNVYA
ncbi:MAG: phage head morphogenesis protein, partial [Lachnospiraceae bacterium]|nr:phage head morphogenesis protein [Lachnospiraceae bacterium]